jgi:plastocyanin
MYKPLQAALPVLVISLLAGGGSPSEQPEDRTASSQSASHDPARPRAAAAPSAAARRPAAAQVVIDNFTFNPRRLTVRAGTRVTWVNRDDVPHTATSVGKPRVFDSRALDTDEQFSHTFKTPGTYKYFCAVHPKMTAEVVVTAR